MDLVADRVDAELARPVGLGATILEEQPDRSGFVVLTDPEGNELCLMR